VCWHAMGEGGYASRVCARRGESWGMREREAGNPPGEARGWLYGRVLARVRGGGEGTPRGRLPCRAIGKVPLSKAPLSELPFSGLTHDWF
jgi:hypothetical protein